MDIVEYKIKSRERIKQLWRSGKEVSEIALLYAMDSLVIRQICKNEPRIESHHHSGRKPNISDEIIIPDDVLAELDTLL